MSLVLRLACNSNNCRKGITSKSGVPIRTNGKQILFRRMFFIMYLYNTKQHGENHNLIATS